MRYLLCEIRTDEEQKFANFLQAQFLDKISTNILNIYQSSRLNSDDEVILCDGVICPKGIVIGNIPSLQQLLKNKETRGKAEEVFRTVGKLGALDHGPLDDGVIQILRKLKPRIYLEDLGLEITEEGSENGMSYSELETLIRFSRTMNNTVVRWNGRPLLILKEREERCRSSS